MRGYAAIGLTQPKFSTNVGGAFRAAYCYGAAMIAIEGKRFERQAADTTKAHRSIPLLRADNVMDLVPFDCVPVAIELVDGAESLVDFVHPERAFYVFGPEDGSIPKSRLERCARVIQVPTKACMNLAATVNVVLYDRMAKGMQ